MGKVGLLATNYPLEDKVPLKIQTYSSVNAFLCYFSLYQKQGFIGFDNRVWF